MVIADLLPKTANMIDRYWMRLSYILAVFIAITKFFLLL
jgi:hypothetical protein